MGLSVYKKLGGINSTASIAKLLHAPVILVLDARSIGESAAAVAMGFREYDRDINLAGVILNNIGSDYHLKIITDALAEKGIKFLGALRRYEGIAVPERHLGLALEHKGENVENIRLAFDRGIDVESVLKISEDVQPLHAEPKTYRSFADNVKIGVARDEAFSFYYPDSLAVLGEMGANIVYFSPLNDEVLPDCNGYIFGGGYPEMFAASLYENTSMLHSIRRNTRPVLAECGGMMYLCRNITDTEGHTWPMSGVIPFEAHMTNRAVLGYMEARAIRDNILCDEGTIIRGHEFHYSQTVPEIYPDSCAFSLTRRNTYTSHFGGYAKDNVLASYLHINFFGNEGLAERFIASCIDMK